MKKILASAILYYLRFWARLALQMHKPVVIGITGSVGKSSARTAIYAMLKRYFPTKTIEEGNSETGIPLGVLGIHISDFSLISWLKFLILCPFRVNYLKRTKYLVIEMGVDEPYAPKNMEYLLTIVKPDIAVYLNAFTVHSQQFDQTVAAEITGVRRIEQIIKNIAKEKGKIITQSGCKITIYNADNKNVVSVIESFLPSAKNMEFVKYGKDIDNNIYYGPYDIDARGNSFMFKMKSEDLGIDISDYVLPREYQEILAAAILVGKYIGLSSEQIITGLEKGFYLPPGRSSVLTGIKNSIIIDSSYNASRVSVLAFLDLLDLLKKKEKSRPVVFVYGDMRELGEEARHEHEEVAKTIPGVVDYLYCVGLLTKKFVIPQVHVTCNMKHVTMKEVKWFKNSVEVGSYLKDHLPENALVLVKGSQNTIFLEEAIKYILKDKNDEKKLCRQSEFWISEKSRTVS